MNSSSCGENRSRNLLLSLANYVLDLVFPPQCVGCRHGGHVLCPSCLDAIRPLAPPFCWHCHTSLVSGDSCKQCQHYPLHINGLRAVSAYQEPLRTCIYALKYRGNRRIAEPLGHLLAEAYLRYQLQADAIVPVPLHYERQYQRGYNQAALLARSCAERVGVPVCEDLVIRQRATPAQVGLGLRARVENVAGAFLCPSQFSAPAMNKRSIVIIDDVCTTGATIEACAAPLFAAGVRSIWGLVLARPGMR